MNSTSLSKAPLPPAYVDARGSIQNLLEQPCGGVSIIRTKAGEYRSNHWHRTDGHWLYVLSGLMQYRECPVDGDKPPAYPEPALVMPGEMVYTGPNLWHQTFFPIDTVLISMSLRPRDTASHEADVVRAP